MSDNSGSNWWQSILAAVLILGLTVFVYYYFTDLETAGGSREINWILALLYIYCGKWVTCGIFGALGVYGLGKGIVQWKSERSS
ncbi:MAG: hypothetical protein HY290_01350 [Planctomycetia bacterium]|nr:hypothetical protein [Planctomycetia bacterium]